MAIPITCECGRKAQAKDTFAGKSVRCPSCRQTIHIPQLGAFSATSNVIDKGLFEKFSDAQKRQMLDWNLVVLLGENGRRKGTVNVVDFTGTDSLIRQLSDAELGRLIDIRKLYSRADSTNGAQAIDLYQQIAKLAPWDEICLMTVGVEYAGMGEFAEAIRWLKKAHSANPANPRVKSNLDNVVAVARRT